MEERLFHGMTVVLPRELSWDQIGDQECFQKTTSKIAVDVHSDINPSPASCSKLDPGTGRCPELVKRAISYSIQILVPVTTPHLIPCNSLVSSKHFRDPLCLAASQVVPYMLVSCNKLYEVPCWSGQPLSSAFPCPPVMEVDFQY